MSSRLLDATWALLAEGHAEQRSIILTVFQAQASCRRASFPRTGPSTRTCRSSGRVLAASSPREIYMRRAYTAYALEEARSQRRARNTPSRHVGNSCGTQHKDDGPKRLNKSPQLLPIWFKRLHAPVAWEEEALAHSQGTTPVWSNERA
eukprot:576689-Pleurochrysis_carterae.AAC.3